MLREPEHILPPLAQLLTEGGDARITPDVITGRNRYGCMALPQPDVLVFGSCTASPPGTLAWQATDRWRTALAARFADASPETVRAAETTRMMQQFIHLLGFHHDEAAVRLVASGTDAHRLAVTLFAHTPLRVIMMATHETGSGVPAALQPVIGSVDVISLREADASLRPVKAVDWEVEQAVRSAVQAGEQVLLVAIDGSKTGLIAPSLPLMKRLQVEWGDMVTVLVDGSQFRLAPATIRRYVQSGWLVALTGSKFMAGPSFSGALLGNAALLSRLPMNAPAFGVLARWHAALFEMTAFFALDEKMLASSLFRLNRKILALMQKSTFLALLPGNLPEYGADERAESWDGMLTIFPFLLRDAYSGQPLSFRWASDCYRQLQQPDVAGQPPVLLGQPVICGTAPDGEPLAALRLCLSAPLLVTVMQEGFDGLLDDVARVLSYIEAWGKKTGIRRCPEYRMEDEDRT